MIGISSTICIKHILLDSVKPAAPRDFQRPLQIHTKRGYIKWFNKLSRCHKTRHFSGRMHPRLQKRIKNQDLTSVVAYLNLTLLFLWVLVCADTYVCITPMRNLNSIFLLISIPCASIDDWQLRLRRVHGLTHVADPYSEWLCLGWKPVLDKLVSGAIATGWSTVTWQMGLAVGQIFEPLFCASLEQLSSLFARYLSGQKANQSNGNNYIMVELYLATWREVGVACLPFTFFSGAESGSGAGSASCCARIYIHISNGTIIQYGHVISRLVWRQTIANSWQTMFECSPKQQRCAIETLFNL